MTNLERFWLDLMEGRRHIINEVYGNEAMLRYRPHPKEKEYFMANNGRMAYDRDIADYTNRFWKFCEDHYQHHKQAYFKRIEDNAKKARSYPEYKRTQQERQDLKEKMRRVILDHAKETQHQDRQQSQ